MLERLTPRRKRLVTEHLDWAFETIRWHARRKYPTFSFEADELRSMVQLALVQCACRWVADTGTSFKTFAARRVMGCLDDSLRRNGYANATAAPITEALGGSTTLDEGRIDAEATRGAVRTARAKLAPMAQVLIGLMYDEGLDAQAAADRLGVPVPQVETWHRQALRLLAAEIKHEKTSRGGLRFGAGRPRVPERCLCGVHTMRRAVTMKLRCREVSDGSSVAATA
jgi:RNA polymerase sigma factor (sigma-70 family)